MSYTVYTISDIARIFKVNPRTVYRWIQNGKLVPMGLGGTKRFSERQVEHLYSSLSEKRKN